MMRHLSATLAVLLCALPGILPAAAPPASNPELAGKALTVLRTHCYRCHGQDGAVEGGLNYILDTAKLVARRKVVPGQPEKSPLYLRMKNGKMPPPDVAH